MNYKKTKKIKTKAFSLIELSIVILIIGILVAGVTQSSRLVNQFRLTSARNITLGSPLPAIKDLALWFDAVNERAFDSQISNGSSIAYWQDTNPQNTTQYRFIQNTVGDQSFYASNGINGLPSIRYNSTHNTTRMFASMLGSLPRENTIFLVMRWDVLNQSINQSYIFSINGEVDNLENAITPPNNFYFGYYPGGPNALTGVIPNNTNHILRRVYNNRTNFSGIYLNGTLASSSTAPLLGNFSNTGNTSICLGNHAVAPRTYGGFFGEFIIFNRALNNDEIIDVERYLSRKWSIKLSY